VRYYLVEGLQAKNPEIGKTLIFGFFSRLWVLLRLCVTYFPQRKRRQLANLREYQERLRVVVNDLLTKADEVDQQSKYSGVPNKAWVQELRVACTALVKLGDQLPEIDRLLAEENVGDSQQIILESCRKAHEIGQQLRQLRQNEQST